MEAGAVEMVLLWFLSHDRFLKMHMGMESAIIRIPMAMIYFILLFSSFIMIIFLIDQMRSDRKMKKGEDAGTEI